MDEEPPGPSSIIFSFNGYCANQLFSNHSLRKDIAVKGGYN